MEYNKNSLTFVFFKIIYSIQFPFIGKKFFLTHIRNTMRSDIPQWALYLQFLLKYLTYGWTTSSYKKKHNYSAEKWPIYPLAELLRSCTIMTIIIMHHYDPSTSGFIVIPYTLLKPIRCSLTLSVTYVWSDPVESYRSLTFSNMEWLLRLLPSAIKWRRVKLVKAREIIRIRAERNWNYFSTNFTGLSSAYHFISWVTNYAHNHGVFKTWLKKKYCHSTFVIIN